MALIAAVCGSLIGLIVAILSVSLFGMSMAAGIGVYAGVAFMTLGLCTLSMVLRPETQARLSVGYEDELDAQWAEIAESNTKPFTDEEQNFQDSLDTPLTDTERRIGHDRDSA